MCALRLSGQDALRAEVGALLEARGLPLRCDGVDPDAVLSFVGRDKKRYEKGTPVIQRADFNTLDNPFFWAAGGVSPDAAAGVHFVAYAATTDRFNRTRRAMDGQLPTGKVDLEPRSRAQGFNSIIRATHRQNFLVPPRARRSFPLAELAKQSGDCN